ncbi:unnamed protein product, partial [Ilex paraguariensis]
MVGGDQNVTGRRARQINTSLEDSQNRLERCQKIARENQNACHQRIVETLSNDGRGKSECCWSMAEIDRNVARRWAEEIGMMPKDRKDKSNGWSKQNEMSAKQ